MLRILANENFPRAAVDALREAGHDVAWVRTDAPGSSDREVLARAKAEERLLLTFDKDFGELAFRSGLSSDSGIILFRILAPSPVFLARLTVRALGARTDWAGHFSVVENDRVRMTPLPLDAGGESGGR
jgi:predicted nuclease of predicted toxin-antitoxin system